MAIARSGEPLSLDERLRQEHGRGLSQRDVAERIGASQRWVCDRLRRLGLAPNGYATEASRRKRAASSRLSHAMHRLRATHALDAVELIYPVASGVLPRNGYRLFSALCRAGWPIHGERDFQLLGLPPDVRAARPLRSFAPRGAVLVRCPAGRVPALLGGLGRFASDGGPVILGEPVSRPIPVAPRLASHLVTIKNATDEQAIADAVRAALDALGIRARVAVGGRGVIHVASHAIVGYAVMIDGLSGDRSVRLQAAGVGGRNRFGCGVFLPA